MTHGPSRGISTDVNRHVPERATTKVVMILNLNPKFEGLKIRVFRLFVVQPLLFYSMLKFNT